jgi:hypothetical protein
MPHRGVRLPLAEGKSVKLKTFTQRSLSMLSYGLVQFVQCWKTAGRVLWLCDHEGQTRSIPELKESLPHISDSEQVLQAVLTKECLQGMISSEASCSPNVTADVYKVTSLGKNSVLREGISPVLTERARRKFYQVSEHLFDGIREDLMALQVPSGYLTVAPLTICQTVFRALARIRAGFREAYVEPLAGEGRIVKPIHRTWLAHRLTECWRAEFIRARIYAIDVCESRGTEESATTSALSSFDHWSASLEDSVWNESLLLLLSTSSEKLSASENVNVPSLLRPVALEDKALLRDILSEQERFVSLGERDIMLKANRPAGFRILFDLSGSPPVAAERVIQTLLEEPLTSGDPRLTMLKNICDDIHATPEVPQHRKNQLSSLMSKYIYLWG